MIAGPARRKGHARPPRSLRDVAPGGTVRVTRITADVHVAKRLADLGLTPGASATVVQATPTALIIAVRDCRIALGRPLAGCVAVEAEDRARGAAG